MLPISLLICCASPESSRKQSAAAPHTRKRTLDPQDCMYVQNGPTSDAISLLTAITGAISSPPRGDVTRGVSQYTSTGTSTRTTNTSSPLIVTSPSFSLAYNVKSVVGITKILVPRSLPVLLSCILSQDAARYFIRIKQTYSYRGRLQGYRSILTNVPTLSW